MKARRKARPSTRLRAVPIALAGLAILSAAATAAEGKPPADFLDRAKQSLSGDFLLWPDIESLRHRAWTAEATFNSLDSEERPLRPPDKVLIRYDPAMGQAERRIYREGELFRTQTSSFSGLWASQWCPESEERCLLQRDQVWSTTRFEFAGEEPVDGRPCLLFDFETAPSSKKRFPLAVRSSNAAGRAWFDKSDLTLVKVEAEYVKDVVLAKGFLVGGSEIPQGTRWTWQMRRTPDDLWLPSFRVETRKVGKFPSGFRLKRSSIKFHDDTRP